MSCYTDILLEEEAVVVVSNGVESNQNLEAADRRGPVKNINNQISYNALLNRPIIT